ncbi:MAG: hypothetical protein AB7N91_28840 [Candidatus Tectimicrobiota bacterium]
MTQVDHHYDTLTDVEDWQESSVERSPRYEVPAVQEGRFRRFVQSLTASMMLQKRRHPAADQQHRSLSPTEILAQNYPHLYLRVMCG